MFRRSRLKYDFWGSAGLISTLICFIFTPVDFGLICLSGIIAMDLFLDLRCHSVTALLSVSV